MRVWIIQHGDYLPTQEGARLMRTGGLARALESRGHHVTWWCSTFSHPGRTLVYDQDYKAELTPGLTLMAVHAGSYEKNISYERYRHHCRFTRGFSRLAEQETTPNIVIVAFPIPDLALAAVRYAKSKGIPCIVDMIDMWPEVFIERVSEPFQNVARLLLRPWFQTAAAVFQEADQVVACSHGYLDWALKISGRKKAQGEKVFYFGYADEEISGDLPINERMEGLRKDLQGKVVFTYLGAFGFAYDLLLVCRVAKRISATLGQGIHFVLAGGGQRFAELSRITESMDNVTLTGWLDGPEMSSLLKMSDVGLIPRCGTLSNVPNKPIEYMAAGLPMLSSLEGEMADIISRDDIGSSYSAGDDDALYELIKMLAVDPIMRKRQGKNAPRTIPKRV